MAEDGNRSRVMPGGGGDEDIVMVGDGEMTARSIAQAALRVAVLLNNDKRKRPSDHDPTSPSSGDDPSPKRGKGDQEISSSSTGATSSSSSPRAEEQRPDEPAPEQGPEPGPLNHVMSTLMQGLRIGEKKLEMSKAKARADITRAPPRMGGMALTGVDAVRQVRPLWHSPFTERESLNAFFPAREPAWIQQHEAREDNGEEDSEACWEDMGPETRSEKLGVGRFRAQRATKSLAAATDSFNMITFQVPPVPAELNVGPGGKPLDLLDRLRFWAAKTGGLRRVNCKRFRFEVLSNAPFPSLEEDLKKEPGGFSRWSDGLYSPGVPLRKKSVSTSTSLLEQFNALVATQDGVLRDLKAIDSGVLRIYHGSIPDLRNRPHPWIWFEIRRPVVEDRPSLVEMPPSMHPMPGGMLVFALPQKNLKVLYSKSGKLCMALSHGGIPSFEFTHSGGIRDKVAGLPPDFLCVSKYDQSELKGDQEKKIDIYNDTDEATAEGDDSEEDGIWDSWYRWLCRECTKDQEVWRAIFRYMTQDRLELTVETLDNEPWMGFENGEWKETGAIAARNEPAAAAARPPARTGPKRRSRAVSNPRPLRSSGLRNEIKPEDDKGEK
ncbi:hypothetical protein MAPG_04377, partial [Magnaporthiopsis poae ATCC 64411]|uniref:Uncharacterized protein n=1 Tax=Magnaporthiopsis poae (strain ATCC 64411 / 73-15) TaxID=644358 RepID=A0A0C4DWJ6_MAGP6